MSQQDELLDLVNSKDIVTGTIWRSEYARLATDDLGYIRAVEMFIVNSRGQFWIPKRTADKRIAPNGYDFSVGGHVSSGETYMDAMLKEISEEINLYLSEEDLEYVGKIGPDANRYFRQMYIYRSDKTPAFNPSDFVDAEWIEPGAIIDRISNGAPAKSTLADAVKIAAAWLEKENH